MIGFRTIAPTPVDFGLAPGTAVRDPRDYVALWRRAAAEHGGQGLTFLHAEPQGDSGTRYRSISDDALERPLHVVEGAWAPATLGVEVPAELAEQWAGVERVEARLYDHGILVVELSGAVALDDPTPVALDRLQEALVGLTTLAAVAVQRAHLLPLLRWLRRVDAHEEVVEFEADDVAAVEPKWVARALVLDRALPATEAVARHWLVDAGAPEQVDAWVAGEQGHVARWLNYVFAGSVADDAVTLAGRGEEAWRGMRYAQYFYSALDRVDDQLNVVLAQTAQGRKRWELADLKHALRSLSHRAEVVMNQLHDLRKYVTRTVRHEMDHILEVWDFEELIGEPVRFKIGSCDRRLGELAAGEQARANTITDIILLVIGVTSVLATALALTQFGRDVGTDPSQAAYGSGSSGITEWFASQPVDAIVVSSVAISVLFVVLFLAVRRPEGS